MAKAKKTIILMIAFVLMCGFTIGLTACGDKEPILCYFDIVNPETGEHLVQADYYSYEDAYLTYDGEQKQLDIKVRRRDNNKQVLIDGWSATITYVNPVTGKYEYNQPFMREKGLYFFYIDEFEYDSCKYRLVRPSGVDVYIQ